MADEGKKIVRMEKARAEKVAAFNRETYGEVIRASRLRRGLSQPQLAALLSTSKNYVSNWEHGRARPDMNIIPQLCAALGIRIAEFSAYRAKLTNSRRSSGRTLSAMRSSTPAIRPP